MRVFLLAMMAAILCTTTAIAQSPNDGFGLGGQRDGLIYGDYTTLFFGDGATSRDSCECLDLVFVIDVTGSMDLAITNVQAGILSILDLAQQTCGNVQAGVISFHDDVIVDQAFTFDMNLVNNAIQNLAAGGGDNEPEASDEALREAFTATTCPLTGDFDPSGWRDGCCKVAILVTDANPGGCDDFYATGVDDVNAHQRALDALGLGVKIGAVFVPTWGDPGGTITPIMVDYAATTGGVYGQTAPNGDGTAAAIEQIILDCVGTSITELCCLPGECLRVLEGDCEVLGGYVVDDCVECDNTPAEKTTWGEIKSAFRK